MKVTKSKAGWLVHITNMVNGCLEQGGVSGRIVLYRRSTLERLGIGYDDDPQADRTDFVTTLQCLLHWAPVPDRVIRRGHLIE